MTDEPTPAPRDSEGANSPTEDKTRLISLAEAAAEMYWSVVNTFYWYQTGLG